MTSKDYKWFNIAKELAYTSEYNRYKIGCVIVMKKHIISVGINSNKTHPIQKYYNQYRFDIKKYPSHHSLHAEIQALVSVPYGIDLNDAVLYTYREHANGDLAKSRPCPSCLQMIKDRNIKKIFYTTDDGYCEEILN